MLDKGIGAAEAVAPSAIERSRFASSSVWSSGIGRSFLLAAGVVVLIATHAIHQAMAAVRSWRRQPSQSASARCTNLVLRHAHTSRAFDNGEPISQEQPLEEAGF